MKKQINDLLLKMQTGENCIGETANALLILYSVSSSAKYTAETIQALNNTLLANKTIGNYKHIEKGCVEKLNMLINKIE